MAKVLTYNLWHGLSPQGILRFREMEPKTRRQLRQKYQVDLLRQQGDFDVCFLQEVNPVENRALEMAESLNKSVAFCRDNSGLKLGKLGAPWNLDSGLAILFGSQQFIESQKVLRLSDDGKTVINDVFSFQTKESRSALLVSTYNNQSGRSLWVNTHLHHGIEFNEDVKSQIESLRSQGLFSEGVELELKDRLLVPNQRRKKEVEVLLKYLSRVKRRYNSIVIGGDLNASPDSPVLEQFRQFGFVPLETQPLESWSPEKNMSNHLLSKEYVPALLLDDLSFDKKVVRELFQVAQSWESKPRKIDYLLGWSQTGQFQVKNSELIGVPESDEMAPSDHFGIKTEYQWDPLSND